jgi:hypothetical protein
MGSLLAVLSGGSSSSGGAAAGVSLVFFLIYIAVIVLTIAGMWKTFEKAGQKGWAAIVPILNYYVIIKLVGREVWWIILLFIPCVNIVVAIILFMDLAKKFGKSEGYGIGLALLPFIFFPMLGFGKDEYQGDRTPVF